MNSLLITEYPFWYITFCLALGVIYALIVYLKNKKFRYSKSLTWGLAILRTLTITAIAFLLLQPYIKTEKKIIQRPTLLFAQDNSQSILNNDSSYYKDEYLKNIQDLEAQLSKKYDIQHVCFGSNVSYNDSITFSDNETNFSELFNNITNTHRDINALIIASDGNYNKGINPIYSSKNISSPIYTIALGNHKAIKDISILKINHNDITFIKNEFPIEVIWSASMLQGERTVLNIYHNNKLIKSRPINITSDAASGSELIYLTAATSGLNEYTVKIQALDEQNTSNNQRNTFIEVIDDTSKILIIGDAPHPDIKAIKQALEKNIRYSVETSFLQSFNKNILDYNVVILHQIPSNTKKSATLLAQMYNAEIPLLFILGQKTDISFFNSIKTGEKISNFNNIYDPATAIYNQHFSLFEISDATKTWIEQTPPLYVPFGEYSSTPSQNTLLFQKSGNIVTQKPLISLSGNVNNKIGIINGAGLWKWRISDYIENNSHDNFDSFITKIVQYLNIHKDKGRFRIDYNKQYLQSENTIIRAELYNKSYELINTPDISLHLIKNKTIDYIFTFDKKNDKYYLDAGQLSEGAYTFEASTKYDGEILKKTGEFVVKSINKEGLITRANHQLLKQLSEQHKGKLFYKDELDQLSELLLKADTENKVSYNKSYHLILNQLLIFILIIFTLSLEWFLRKYNGGY